MERRPQYRAAHVAWRETSGVVPEFPLQFLARSTLEWENVMKTEFERAERTVPWCARFLFAALLLIPSFALGQAQFPANPEPAAVPFKVHVPEQILIDLRRRLAETRWPDQLPGTTWEYG